MRVMITFFLLISFALAGNNQSLIKLVKTYSHSQALINAHWSLFARDVQSGKVLLDLNSRKRMAPASGLKLFTSAAALELLGPEYRYHTRIYSNGQIDARGTLHGDLIIRGSGDPTLGSDRVQGALALDTLMQSWVQAIRAAGIRNIDGKILADATLYGDTPIPGNWLWIDLGNYYGSGVSALSVNENLYRLYFTPGQQVGLPAKVLRTMPAVDLTFINEMKTGAPGSGDNGYIYRAPNANIATLRGTIPAGVDSFYIKGSLPNPALFCADYFRNALLRAGIRSDGSEILHHLPTYQNFTLLHTTISQSLSKIIFHLNKRSVNHIAEQLLFTIAADSLVPASREVGLKRISSFLKSKGIGTAALHLVDGSGLSPNNSITTRMMVGLLTAMTASPEFNIFVRSLALAGDKEDLGYFKSFGRNTIIEKKCRIKSGLIEGVRSHSGYLETKSGRLVAFSFIANKIDVPARKIDKLHEKILIRLAELKY